MICVLLPAAAAEEESTGRHALDGSTDRDEEDKVANERLTDGWRNHVGDVQECPLARSRPTKRTEERARCMDMIYQVVVVDV